MRPNTAQLYRERMLRVLVHIQEHLDEDLPLDELARAAHFSPYHFHRIFRGMVGESVKEHIRRLRLERAAGVLRQTRRSVTRIAFDAGYENHESFTRAFRSCFHLSPSEYRRKHSLVESASSPTDVHFDSEGRGVSFRPLCQGGNVMDVEVKTIGPKRVAFMRHVGPYSECGATWQRLLAWAAPRGLLSPGVTFIGVCHDDPDVTPPERVRYDACITIDEDIRPEGEVGVQELAGGTYAVTTHIGPYDKLGETYATLCGRWAPQSGWEIRSTPCFEVYLNDPEGTDPEDLLTEIYMPLEGNGHASR